MAARNWTQSFRHRRRSSLLAAAVSASLAAWLGSLALAPCASAAFPGRNGKIAFSLQRGGPADIYTMNAQGRHLRRLTGSGPDWQPAFSPSGRKIAFEKYIDGNVDIYTVLANGRHERRLVHTPNTDEFGPAFSPNGKRIVFARREDDATNQNIYSVRVDGSNLKRLTHTREGDGGPEFSPNGRRIVFQRDGDIAVMRPDGSRAHKLTHNGLSIIETHATFSPNGKWIAYVGIPQPSGSDQIYKMKADGSRRKKLTRAGEHNWNPAFSPSGRRIVFSSDRRGDRNSDIWVMRSDGSNERRLTGRRTAEAEPSWGVRP